METHPGEALQRLEAVKGARYTRTIRKHQTGFDIIGALQWRVSDQQGTEPSRCRLSIHGKYHSTTWLDAVAVVVAASINE